MHHAYLGVSKDNGTPKSSILIGFSIIDHPFCFFPLFLETSIYHRWSSNSWTLGPSNLNQSHSHLSTLMTPWKTRPHSGPKERQPNARNNFFFPRSTKVILLHLCAARIGLEATNKQQTDQTNKHEATSSEQTPRQWYSSSSLSGWPKV